MWELFHFHFRKSWLYVKFLVNGIFCLFLFLLSAFKACPPTGLCPLFLEKSTVNLNERVSLIVMKHFSYWFKIFSLSLAFSILALISLGVNLLVFIILIVHWVSWICRLVFLINFRNFTIIISSNIFRSFSFASDNLITFMVVH